MASHGPASAFESEYFGKDAAFRLEQPIGSMSISPCGRDVVLASRDGLHIIDLDSPYSPPRYLPHHTSWEVADVQWSPFASRDYWVVSTSNQKALVWNLAAKYWEDSVDIILHGHMRAITDINFSAHHPDILATCAVDSFVHCWDLRAPSRPAFSFSDWFAGATQVKWSRQDSNVVASSHDKYLRIWDKRMGAHPTRSIEAHGTKIYGVDWNRFLQHKIVTCSLDRTIKFWDLDNPEDVPERIIETPFPVWRARHTPFGWGILAMPQRGNNDLHLYDRRQELDGHKSGPVTPVATFSGHKGQVKEFLWRARGTFNDGIDHRDFQLVSWGTDRELKLHKIETNTLLRVGYEKGVSRTKRLNFTRKGAEYKTFRDEPANGGSPQSVIAQRDSISIHGQPFHLRPRGSTSVGMSKASIPQFRGWVQGVGSGQRTGMHGKASARQDMTPIAWMKNVRISTWDQETLAEEISQISENFTKVDFEEVDVQQRKATVSMTGPWGDQNASVYLRVDMRFPKAYPREANAKFSIQKTPSMSDALVDTLSAALQKIAATYAERKKGCIEAVLRYLLRDQSLEQALSFILEEALDESKLIAEQEVSGDLSSDDDDDPIRATANLLDSNANVRVPLAKACGALWADNGTLVCFFPPKAKDLPSITDSMELRDPDQSRSVKLFEGFGRLHPSSLGPKSTIGTKTTNDDGDSDSDGTASTSSGSSASSDMARAIPIGMVQKGWHRNVFSLLRKTVSADRSNRSLNRLAIAAVSDNARANVVSLHVFEDLIPSKPSLGQGYRIFGNGPDVCQHNAMIAKQGSNETLASAWGLAKLILQNNVPLDCVQDPMTERNIITIAKSASESLWRRDSAIDLSHDEQINKPQVRLSGRVRWGNHPLGPRHLVPELFKYFENTGDVQMLAMLSCVFAEPRASNPEWLLTPHKVEDLSIELQTPAFGVDYYPSLQVAQSTMRQTPDLALKVTNLMPSGGLEGFAQSSNASDPPRQSEKYEIRTSASAGDTPPVSGAIPLHIARQPSGASSIIGREFSTADSSTHPSAAVSISTSPEENRLSRRSNSTIAFSFSRASFSALHQAYSNSPPTVSSAGPVNSQKGHSPSGSLVPSGWSTAGIFGTSSSGKGTRTAHQLSGASSDENKVHHIASSSSLSNLRSSRGSRYENPDTSRVILRSASRLEDLETTSSTVKSAGRRRKRIKVALHNQNKFDNDGYASVPLLEPKLEWKFKAYRASYAHLLGVWELYPQKAEILKFDGLVSYFDASGTGNYGETQTQGWTLDNVHRRKTVTAATKSELGLKRGLELRKCCRECGDPLAPIEKNGVPIGWHCTSPSCLAPLLKKSIREACVICLKFVSGLVVPCLQCGHASCYSCAEEWYGPAQQMRQVLDSQSVQDEADNAFPSPGARECPSGCGCQCPEQDTIKVPYPPEPEPDLEAGREPEVVTEPNAEQEPEILPRPKKKFGPRSDRLMSEHGPDTAIGAFLSLTRTRSISAAKESVQRERSVYDSSAIDDGPVTPNTEDELNPWSHSKFAGLGRGIGGGLSRGLSTKSSDATIRKDSRR